MSEGSAVPRLPVPAGLPLPVRFGVACAVVGGLVLAWGEARVSSQVAMQTALVTFAAPPTYVTLARVQVVGRCEISAAARGAGGRCAA